MALSPVFRHASSTPPPSAGACARPPPGPAASWWWRPGTSPAGRVTADEARLPAAGDRPRCPGPAPEGCAPARRQPVPGRGPVEVSGVAGYFRYFGSRAAAPIKTWYSFRLGSWHLVALNSNCQAVDARPRRPGSAPNWCSTAMTTTTSASPPGSAWPTRSGQRPARVVVGTGGAPWLPLRTAAADSRIRMTRTFGSCGSPSSRADTGGASSTLTDCRSGTAAPEPATELDLIGCRRRSPWPP